MSPATSSGWKPWRRVWRRRDRDRTMMPIETGPLVKKLEALLASREDVSAAFLFGSYASGFERRDADEDSRSDVDVAVLFRDRPSRESLAELESLLSRNLDGMEVDLVSLNEAPPALCRQVLLEGKPLVGTDAAHWLPFFARAMTDYHDLRLSRASIEKAVLGVQ